MADRKAHYYAGYGKELLRRLFASFDTAGTVIALLGTIAFVAAEILDATGTWPDNTAAQIFVDWTPRAYAALMAYLIIVHVPARIWRDAQPFPFDLDIRRAVAELPSGNTWILRLAVFNNGPGGLFEAELSSVEGGALFPTTEVPLLWSPNDEDLKYLDERGPVRWVLLGFATNTATTVTDPPRTLPAFIYEPPPGHGSRRSIDLVDDEMRLSVLVRNYDTRQSESAVVRVWADGERIEAALVN